MDYLIICATSLLISILTILSGFGLGTVLMPVFALFFPLPIAIASTAVVHLATNLFNSALVGKFANKRAVLWFGLPAAIAAILGAYSMSVLSKGPWLGTVIGLLIIFSALFALLPSLTRLTFPPQFLPIGGVLSGFFGGLSGSQGVFRSAFLIKSGLSKEEFIGTGVICAIIVDIVRLVVYGIAFYSEKFAYIREMKGLLLAASLTAFLGSYIGSLLMHQVTFRGIQIMVGIMLLVIGAGIAIGFI